MQVEEGAFIADEDVEKHVEVVIRLVGEEELVEVLEVGNVATRLLVKEELGKESLKDELSKSSADDALLCRIRAGRTTTKSVPDVASLSQVKARRTINGSVESVRKRPRIHLTWNASRKSETKNLLSGFEPM